MDLLLREQQLHYTFRVGAGLCLIGHGSFGVITKSIWCNYFAVFGIDHDVAYQLMPWVGSMDIILGITMLVYPMRSIALWLVIWGTITALLRPLSGEPPAEFIERAGNFGTPLAMLILSGRGKNTKAWFTQIELTGHIDSNTFLKLEYCLRIVGFLLLCGHGWLNLLNKPSLLDQYSSLGFSNTVNVAQTIGIIEIVGACSILIYPLRSVVLVLVLWKIGSELLYPRYELFEWIERGGSYCSLLALLLLIPERMPDQYIKRMLPFKRKISI